MNVPKAVQARIVSAIEQLDVLLDAIPDVEIEVTQREAGYFNFVTRIARRGGWGCRFGIANLSATLDERWDTGVWKKPKKYSVSYSADELTEQVEALIREGFFPEPTVDRSQPGRIKIVWIEHGLNPQDALREAREAVRFAGLSPRLGAFTFPREITE